MTLYRALAPAKVNLGLFLGPTRQSDARHELASVMQSISLADEVALEVAPAGLAEDEIVCPGVPGPPEANLAARALAAFRERVGWRDPPVRVSIEKRIPVAGGLAGGSADAAATLRLAGLASGLGDERVLRELAGELGADVPAQVSPGRWLATGAGERLRELAAPRVPLGLLVLALDAELSTAAVYAHADRLGLPRTRSELARLERELEASFGDGAAIPPTAGLLHNDLQRAAVSLCPEIECSLEQAREAGADLAFLSGSGPTVVGLFLPGQDGEQDAAQALGRARRGAHRLRERTPGPLCAQPVAAGFARARLVARSAGD